MMYFIRSTINDKMVPKVLVDELNTHLESIVGAEGSENAQKELVLASDDEEDLFFRKNLLKTIDPTSREMQ